MTKKEWSKWLKRTSPHSIPMATVFLPFLATFEPLWFSHQSKLVVPITPFLTTPSNRSRTNTQSLPFIHYFVHSDREGESLAMIVIGRMEEWSERKKMRLREEKNIRMTKRRGEGIDIKGMSEYEIITHSFGIHLLLNKRRNVKVRDLRWNKKKRKMRAGKCRL